MFCLLYSPKQKIVKFHALKQTGKSHVIDVFTIVKIWKISRCVFFSISLSLPYNILLYMLQVSKTQYSGQNTIQHNENMTYQKK